MKVVLKEDFLKIPDSGVTIKIAARKITVTGPKGSITKDLSHMPVDICVMKLATAAKKGLYVRVRMWNAGKKQACVVTTFKSLISNMITGVTEGYRYKMRCVHAHFPISLIISKDKRQVEVKNFLGGKKGHTINLQPGCTATLTKDVKDEIVIDGIDNAAVSLCCAQISQVCKIGTKDERKFLDGIFVSERTVIDKKD